jgi:hypothetical protein
MFITAVFYKNLNEVDVYTWHSYQYAERSFERARKSNRSVTLTDQTGRVIKSHKPAV